MKPWLLLFFFLWSAKGSGQNYIEYQKAFNRIDNDVSASDFRTALARLDSIYDNYGFIYAKHCIKALQISVTANDSIRAGKWLGRCFRQGVPLWIIRTDKITRESLKYPDTKETLKKYDSLHAVYLSSINSDLAQKIDSLLEIDQKFTQKINNGSLPLRLTTYNWQWKRNNRKQFEAIRAITEKYGFPGERLIGLPAAYQDSVKCYGDISFYGATIYDRRAVTMLIHYFSSPRDDSNELLRKNVVSGYLPAEHYGILNDFLGENGRKRYSGNYYNIWHFDPKNNSEAIERRRKEIGLNTFRQQEKNRIVNRERRKNNTANSEILTE